MTTHHDRDGGARRRRGRGRFAAAIAAIGLGLSGVAASGTTSAAATSTDIVILHAISGVGEADIYLDGALAGAGLTVGQTAGPLPLPAAATHTIEVFDAIASPPATSAARSDDPVEAGTLVGQPGAGSFEHPDGPLVARLSNRGPGQDWFVFEETMPVTDECDPTFAERSTAASADIEAGVFLAGGGSGIFGTGGSTTSRSPGWSQPITVLGKNVTGFSMSTETFGVFEFGVVDLTVGLDHTYFAVGSAGEYGAAEVVYNCVTDRLVSARSVPRNPQYEASRFVPLPPTRLFDTREAPAPIGAIPSGGTIDVEVTGRAGIPASGVSAVVMNLTATNTTARGNVRVWPTGSALPNTANLNVSGPDVTVPNLVTVPVGEGGQVSFFALSQLDLVADVAGYFIEADSASAGRFVPLDPDRLFDTREAPSPVGAVPADGTISVQVAGEAGVPATGADAVVLNLTGIDTGTRGFVTAFPGGSERPTAANLNLTGGGDVAPNLAIVRLGPDGTVDFYAKGGAHLVADVFGYFTDDSAASSSAGLFVPSAPVRIADTRPKPFTLFDLIIAADTSRDVPVAGYGDMPAVGSAAVLANLTGTDAVARGFLTAWPKGSPRPTTANLNLLSPGATRPNAILVPLGDDGAISLYSKSGAHAILDVFGYFTAEPE